MEVKHLGQICIGPTLSDTEIKKVSNSLKSDGTVEYKVKLYSLLAGKTRYKIIKILNELNELCVCDMAKILTTTVSAVSHQLKILRKEKIVKTRKNKQTIYYSLLDKKIIELL